MTEQIVVDNITYKLFEFHGKAVDQQASSETHVSGGNLYVTGNTLYSNPVVSSSYNTKELFLVNDNGQERDFSFTNKDLPAIRLSHIVQVKWLIKEGRERGPFVIVYNQSLNKYFIDEVMITEAMYGNKRHLGKRMQISSILLVAGLGFIIYSFIAESFSSTFFFFVIGCSLMIPYINLIIFIQKIKRCTREMKEKLIKTIKCKGIPNSV